MFSTQREIDVKMPSPEGIKTATLRYPTDEQIIKRATARKIVIKNLGRGQTETAYPNGEAVDLELFQALTVQTDGAAFDSAEAEEAIATLLSAEVIDGSLSPSGFAFTLKVPGGETSHTLAMATQKDIKAFRKGFSQSRSLPYGHEERTVRLNVAAEFYDKLALGSEGYDGAVPVNHKVAIVLGVCEEFERMKEDALADRPNFS